MINHFSGTHRRFKKKFCLAEGYRGRKRKRKKKTSVSVDVFCPKVRACLCRNSFPPRDWPGIRGARSVVYLHQYLFERRCRLANPSGRLLVQCHLCVNTLFRSNSGRGGTVTFFSLLPAFSCFLFPTATLPRPCKSHVDSKIPQSERLKYNHPELTRAFEQGLCPTVAFD